MKSAKLWTDFPEGNRVTIRVGWDSQISIITLREVIKWLGWAEGPPKLLSDEGGMKSHPSHKKWLGWNPVGKSCNDSGGLKAHLQLGSSTIQITQY